MEINLYLLIIALILIFIVGYLVFFRMKHA